jgi:hypothetical protein
MMGVRFMWTNGHAHPDSIFNFGIVRAVEMWDGDWQVEFRFTHQNRTWGGSVICPGATEAPRDTIDSSPE